MRRAFFLLVVLAMLGVSPMANASPEASPPDPTRAAADRDRDGISDELGPRLAAARSTDLVEVVVTLDRPGQARVFHQAVGRFEVVQRFEIIDGFVARVTPAQARALAKSNGVFRVESNLEVTVLNNEAITEWGIDQARGDFAVDGNGVVACVADTGIDASHEQFGPGKILAHFDPYDNSPTPIDPHGHGTHVAGTLAGDGNGTSSNAALYGGVAPGVSLLSSRVLNAQGSGSESIIISGIEWCVDNGAHIISMSLGTATASDGNTAMDQAVNAAVANGVTALVAAGNSGDGPGIMGSPAMAADAITIGAVTKLSDGLRLAPFSSRGTATSGKPDVTAPGVFITSADANTGTGYVSASGTSMSTPFAAGVAALMLASDSSLMPADIKSMMQSTAIDMAGPGFDGDWGHGVLDGYGAIAEANGSSGGMAMPRHQAVTGAATGGVNWTGTFEVTADEVGTPAGLTMLINETACTFFFWGVCWTTWEPDLDLVLRNPLGEQIYLSECPLRGDCGSAGHSETVLFTPPMAGTYELEVYQFSNVGGTFVIDIFTGTAGAPPPPPPPPPGDDPPVAVDDGYSTDEDVQLSVGAPGVLDNDSDPEGMALTVTSWTNGANGAVSGQPDGSFIYTPDSNWNGTDSFQYTVEDPAGNADTGTVTVTVASVADAPVAVDDSDATEEGVAVTIAVLNNDTDVDGDIDPTSVSIDVAASNGVASANADGTVTYTPNGGFSGSDQFVYQVCDLTALCATATVDVDVQAAPPPPPPPPADTVHVSDLDGSTDTFNRGRWRATVTVTVMDDAGAVVSGAAVTVDQDGRTVSCTTSQAGTCTVRSRRLASTVTSATFTVTSVSASGYTYDPLSNHDPDGDSNGTTIVVLAP